MSRLWQNSASFAALWQPARERCGRRCQAKADQKIVRNGEMSRRSPISPAQSRAMT